MNFNIISYFIYFLISTLIIIKVGNICFKNGKIFVLALIPNHEEICLRTNQILLLAYYLLNIGYCAITINYWTFIVSFSQMIQVIASKTAIILLIIGILHYKNILILTNYIKKLI